MPFVKLDKGILTSTIWCLRPELEVFVTALLMAEPRDFTEPVPTIQVDSLEDGGWVVPPGWYGFVPAAGPGIVRAAHVAPVPGMEALKKLASPEPESRSQEFGGRRMVRVNGGYIVLNFMKYRDFDHSAADRMRKLRERRKRNVTANSDGVTRNSDENGGDVTALRRNVTHSREQRQIAEAENTNTSLARSAEREVYDLYPKKRSPKSALKQIALAIKEHGLERIKERTAAYAAAVATWPQADKQFVPDPERWFKRGQFDDDPATWQRSSLASNYIGSTIDPSSEQLTRAREAGWQ